MIAATLELAGRPFPINHDERSIEVFDHIGDAMVAMLERHHTGGRTALNYQLLDGSPCIGQFHDFTPGTEFTCYEVAGPLYGAPTEDQVMDALTDVHSGVWTWKLTLTTDATGNMTIAVRANRG